MRGVGLRFVCRARAYSERVTPSRLILVFDGACEFCTSAANAVVERSAPPITAVAWQLTDLGRLGLTQAQARQRVYLVVQGDDGELRHFGGHLAFAQLLIVQPNRALKFCGYLLKSVPFRWLGALGYVLVARYRHRLPGGTPACAMSGSTRDSHNAVVRT